MNWWAPMNNGITCRLIKWLQNYCLFYANALMSTNEWWNYMSWMFWTCRNVHFHSESSRWWSAEYYKTTVCFMQMHRWAPTNNEITCHGYFEPVEMSIFTLILHSDGRHSDSLLAYLLCLLLTCFSTFCHLCQLIIIITEFFHYLIFHYLIESHESFTLG